jgi:CRP/FNR family cyclic AMP-dependent transcriptional regulator
MGKSVPGQAGRSQKRVPSSTSSTGYATWCGQPIAEPLRQLAGRHPYVAPLDECYLGRLSASKKAKLYPKGSVLFEEGDPPAGALVVLAGRVKVSLTSSSGKALVLGCFGSGKALGLVGSILARPHNTTAEAIQETRAVLIPCQELIKDMRTNPLASFQIAQLISEDCRFLSAKLRAVELANSAAQKMARCLLGLVANHTKGNGGSAHLDLSQETIAQMVGVSRETASRLLSRFRRQGMLDWTRSVCVIRNRRALENLAD